MQTASPIEDVLAVRTPENVRLNYEIAGIGSRFLALIVDGMLLAVLGAAALEVISTFTGFTNSDIGITAVIGIAIFVALFFIPLAYFTTFEGLMSKTPGKSALGLMVIRIEGGGIGFGEAFLRNLARFLDQLAFIGVIVMFLNPQCRRLGDFLAGTVVIRERRSVPRLLSQPYSFGTANGGAGNTGPLGSREYQALQAFFSRPLHPQQRERLARQLAEQLSSRMQLDSNSPERRQSAEAFLWTTYNDLGERLREHP